MKRFLTLTLLTLAVGAGIFVAWMSAGGGAAVELSEDEMAQRARAARARRRS